MNKFSKIVATFASAVLVAGNVMGYQVKNKGIAGGCFCEKEVLEYLKGESFDVAYFD